MYVIICVISQRQTGRGGEHFLALLFVAKRPRPLPSR
nr:MAG TPA: hypothetical protein [Caudoviricetes sp.]